MGMPVSAMAAFVAGDSQSQEPTSLVDDTTAVESAAASEAPDSSGQTIPDQGTVHSIDQKLAKPRSKAAQAKNGRRLESRKDGTTARKVTFYLDQELDTQLSIHAVTTGVDRSTIVCEALAKFLRRQ